MKSKFLFLFLFLTFFSLDLASAAADFQVTGFSCSPSEVAVNTLFSCTATIKNNGDASGSVSIATLYSDSSNWLESSTYSQASGESVNPGSSTEVTFSGLRATKSGNNGFSKIMLDSVTDTYVADVTMNVINVAVTVTNSASSAAVGGEIVATAEVTAGGDIDVSLSFATVSGGCSIGSQENPKSISGMSDGAKQSRTWTITQTSSGNCRFKVTASATGSSGVATTDDSTTKTITCTNCPSGGTSGTGGSTGGGGGGAAGDSDLVSMEKIMFIGEVFWFKIENSSHNLTLLNLSESQALVAVESERQEFNLSINESKRIDLNLDGTEDLLIQLKNINVPTLKATFYLENLKSNNLSSIGEEGSEGEGESAPLNNGGDDLAENPKVNSLPIIIIIAIIIILIPIIFFLKKYIEEIKFKKLISRVKVKSFTSKQ